ncbi:TetR family transcriptional regulator [Streptomyces sp. NPDC057137]|uniref:TetR family transcriptional regulator n=1 Tax=Streptomyces sp. NPDC057137 TaxID=3346030 RepID=UPI003637631F
MQSSDPMHASPAAAGWQERRSDARRNHERIVIAALELFSERGLDATIPQIAARAGVGKATVYRSFATKADLVAALVQYQLQWVETRCDTALDDFATGRTTAYDALTALLHDVSQRLAGDRLLADTIPEDAHSSYPDVVGTLFERAKEDGQVRSDATPEELRLLIGGFAQQLRRLDAHDPAQWERFTQLVLDAFRP